jgi:hypothetical protein
MLNREERRAGSRRMRGHAAALRPDRGPARLVYTEHAECGGMYDGEILCESYDGYRMDTENGATTLTLRPTRGTPPVATLLGTRRSPSCSRATICAGASDARWKMLTAIASRACASDDHADERARRTAFSRATPRVGASRHAEGADEPLRWPSVRRDGPLRR